MTKEIKKRITIYRDSFKSKNILDVYLNKLGINDNSINEIDIYIDIKTINKTFKNGDFITINKD
jgi:hypothetical protein